MFPTSVTYIAELGNTRVRWGEVKKGFPMRSLLFVPADSAKKLDKAMTSGADALIIDLEDSIALDGKTRARQSAAAFLKEVIATTSRPHLLVRVNGLQTGLTDADLDAVVPEKPDAIMLPKAEGGVSVVHADAKLAVREALSGLPDGHIKIVALATETAAALFLTGTYRGASARLSALTWGAEDLSADLGAEANRDSQGRFLDPYRLARALCLAGAAAAEVPALDTVYIDFRDHDGFRRECEEARRDGFAGKMAIHPAQVPIINELFTPTPEALAHAQAIVDAFAANPDAGVVGVGGVMVDQPHLARAKRVLARAPTTKGRSVTVPIHRFRIEHAFVAELERDRASLAERHRTIKTGAAAGMAGAARLLDFDPDRILIAIDAHLDDVLGVTGGLALAPERVARAAEVPRCSRRDGSCQRFRVHVRNHQHVAGGGIGRDAGDQAVGVELRRQRRAFFEVGGCAGRCD